MDELTPASTDQRTPVPDQGRAARRRAAEQAEQAQRAQEPQAAQQPAPLTLSRTERRRLEDAEVSAARSQSALWKAWWVYALIAAVGVAVFLGVRSAADPPPPQPVVTTVPNR